MRPPLTRPGGSATSRMIESAVTLLPHPDSPTTPSVLRRGISSEMPSTARTVPCSVRNSVTRSRISSRGGVSSDTRPTIAGRRPCYHIRMVPTRLAGLALLLLLLPACPHKYKRTYSEPGAEEILESLAARRAAVKSFKTESQMDYWVGNDRFRGTVLIMGALGAKVRMNALRPDDAVAADLACNGADFVFVDQLKICVLTGPCNEASIAQLLRVPLAPDDFLSLALGTTPVIPGAT